MGQAARDLARQIQGIAPLQATRRQTVAVVFIRDPDREGASLTMLQQLWGLTSAESRVCVELVHGRSIAEISALLEVARDTVRKHVKQIFAKTGTNRQASLTSLVLSSLVGVPPSGDLR